MIYKKGGEGDRESRIGTQLLSHQKELYRPESKNKSWNGTNLSILSNKTMKYIKDVYKTIKPQKDVNLTRCQINSFNILIFPYHCTEKIYSSCSLSWFELKHSI